MNFKTLTSKGEKVLINFDNVCMVATHPTGGCYLHYNVTTDEDQCIILVEEDLEELEIRLSSEST
jgi:hypothetical protein